MKREERGKKVKKPWGENQTMSNQKGLAIRKERFREELFQILRTICCKV